MGDRARRAAPPAGIAGGAAADAPPASAAATADSLPAPLAHYAAYDADLEAIRLLAGITAAAALQEELAIVDRLTRFLEQHETFYRLGAAPITRTFRDLRRSLSRETQIVEEQRNFRRAARYDRGTPKVRVPEIFPISNDAATFMEFIAGGKITEAFPGDPAARAELAARLYDILTYDVLFSPAEEAIFHGDPHAGNVFFVRDQADDPYQIALLDWGLSGSLSRPVRADLVQLLLGVLLHDARRRLCHAQRADRRALRPGLCAAPRAGRLHQVAGHRLGHLDGARSALPGRRPRRTGRSGRSGRSRPARRRPHLHPQRPAARPRGRHAAGQARGPAAPRHRGALPRSQVAPLLRHRQRERSGAGDLSPGGAQPGRGHRGTPRPPGDGAGGAAPARRRTGRRQPRRRHRRAPRRRRAARLSGTARRYGLRHHRRGRPLRPAVPGDRPGSRAQRPALRGARSIRGRREDRYRDARSVLVNLEYRWHFAPPLALAIFGDAGMVYHDRAAVRLRDFHTGGGIGLRLALRDGPAFRIDPAAGNEGGRLHFGTGPGF